METIDPELPPYVETTLRALIAIVAIIALTRINGLRSFSKMSSFDFALTVATGSLVASLIVSTSTPVSVGLTAIAAVFAIQAIIAFLRARTGWFSAATDNAPLLLMDGPTILHDNLRKARVTESDLIGKLREANALSFDEVRAVVLEPTGDISVLHGPVDGAALDAALLKGVRRA